MNKLQFKPTKILLVFRVVGITFLCLIIASLITAMTMEMYDSTQAFIFGFLLSFAVLGIYTILFFFSIQYELDDRYISCASGVLWKQRRSIPLEKITNLDVRQGPVERILGYGKIWIFTPSTGAATPEEKLLGIPVPHQVKQSIIDRSDQANDSAVNPSQTPESLDQHGDLAAILIDIRSSLVNIEGHIQQQTKQAQQVVAPDGE